VGWHVGNSGDRLHAVAEKEPNAFGLYDVHGNVWEWCEDDWHDSYESASRDGSAWIDEPRSGGRVVRGGSWAFHPGRARSAFRYGWPPVGRYDNLGFRLARS
jgi:formylglycine-generating enzyme required for sulfatase activity